ncbi:protein Mdm4 isoform X8 [Heterocephalus glaber]|uniref:Protein Mdm4 isoform X8 n=1 Tax=Heterocephalus glaber TaxID=10181 RepID=A0AAX6RMK4_HETGA|nr:protein Mdm4 isoform X8 [Heterocephalus glaber]
MTSYSTSAQCSTSESACRISPERISQVRPKLPLLKILQAAGAQGEMFTVKEVMHYLGQYIMVKQLYDPREQHMVYCGGDVLGELLGRQSFSVKDPSPLYDMLRKNLVTLATATTDAAQTLALAQDHSMDIPSQDRPKQSAQEGSNARKRTEEGDAHTLPTSQHKHKNSRGDEDLIENLTQDETSRLDLGFEEWDVAGLPWWFLGNLRSNYTPRSNGSTDLQTHQMIEVGKSDDLEDSKSLSDDTDVEVTSEDEWQCTECKKFNSPSKRRKMKELMSLIAEEPFQLQLLDLKMFVSRKTIPNYLILAAQWNFWIWLTVLKAKRPSQAWENNQITFLSRK